MKTFYWDFFGPNAQPTAQHFLVHLERFLAENACADCATGLASERDGHTAVWCRSAPASEATILRALRPRRSETRD